MKHVLCLVLLMISMGGLCAQTNPSSITPNDKHHQDKIKAKEALHFEEQILQFESSIEKNKKSDIKATKLMLEQSMLRVMQEGKRSSEKLSREARGKQYLLSKKDQESGKKDSSKQQEIYEQFKAIDDLSGFNLVIMDKLLLEFQDTMQRKTQIAQINKNPTEN